jgi:hypothetical protein
MSSLHTLDISIIVVTFPEGRKLYHAALQPCSSMRALLDTMSPFIFNPLPVLGQVSGERAARGRIHLSNTGVSTEGPSRWAAIIVVLMSQSQTVYDGDIFRPGISFA